MLNYVFDPTIVNPVSARVGQQVMGGLTLRRRRRRAGPAVEDRQGQLPGSRRRGLLAQRQDGVARRLGQVLPQPDRSGHSTTGSAEHDADRLERRRPHADLRAVEPVAERHSGPAGQLAWRADLPRAGSELLEPGLHRAQRPPVLRGVQRELPRRISLEMTYAGSRSYDIEGNWGGYNEPSAAFQAQCDVTHGGSRTLCDQQMPNPYFGVPGFEGTTRFTSAPLSRFELARPFPAFGGFSQNQQNLGKLTYDSMQFVANKRWAKGVTINASYTWVPRWTEDGANTTTGIGDAYVDEVSLLKNTAPTSRIANTASPHRACGSCRGTATRRASPGTSSAAGRSRRCSSTSPDSPGTCPATSIWRRASTSRRSRCSGDKEGQFIYGVKPCIGQRNATTGQYELLAVSTAYGCTRAVLPGPRGVPAPHRDVPLRRVPPAGFLAGGRELREDDADHRPDAVPGTSRGVQPPQQPDVRRAPVQPDPTSPTSAASTATSPASRTSSGSSSWGSG